jgi:endo-1,3(4)-beta-glucanase
MYSYIYMLFYMHYHYVFMYVGVHVISTCTHIHYSGIAASREKALQEIQSGILPWLIGINADNFLYDLTYGGVVPQRGLLDAQADYGSGLYNDHHFHYGYFLYTGAVLAKLSPAFVTPYQAFFDTLAKDICNPFRQDKMFPFVRHKDMYDGHSWASGLFQQGNGKNQESSSEAVNAYYAVTLYAEATGQKDLCEFARVMLTMEIQAVQTYWHVTDGAHIYDDVFGQDLGMIGNVGAFGKLIII